MKRNRYGRFFLEDRVLKHDQHKARAIFNELIVMDARYQYDLLGTVYLAEGAPFELVEEGCAAPKYEVEIDANHNVTFTKKEDEHGR